ncbi:hypothetical protein EDB83DRAFT_2520510 [Lactarius deliciosus]|nr:hypothetical protein EDB83DRAFT_2520510 [Lactarius deliciosus]
MSNQLDVNVTQHGDLPEHEAVARRPPSQREKRSTLVARQQLSDIVSGTSAASRTRPAPRPVGQGRGGKAHTIPRPPRNSGLNPSGIPYDSQLNRPSEFIPPLSTDASSSLNPTPATNLYNFTDPDPTPNVFNVHNSMTDSVRNDIFSTNYSSVYNSTVDSVPDSTSSTDFSFVDNLTATQGGGDGAGASHTHVAPYRNNWPSSSTTVNSLYDAGFPNPASLVNTGQSGPSLFDEPRGPHPVYADSRYVPQQQPLRPGEVTRGGITPPLPLSTWRTTATSADRTRALSTLQGPSGVIRSIGKTSDVLANRHTRRPPYRLPPTPVPSIDQCTSNAGSSRSGSLARGTSASIASSEPDGGREIIAHAKELFRLKLLTVNAMWPDVIARVQARDQLVASYRKNATQIDQVISNDAIDRASIKKVMHDGSNLRHEFKKAAQDIVASRDNYYDLFPHTQNQPERPEHHTVQKVSALLDKTTGLWMHDGNDSNSIPNYFEHPAIEEVIARTIFARPQSIGCRNLDKFNPVRIPVLALASCALHCALEEWATGVFVPVKFEVANYRRLYTSIADLNIQKILSNSYLRAKLETLWARIYSRGCQVGVGTPGVRHVHAMHLFVADVDTTSLVTGGESALTNNPWPPFDLEPGD